MSNLEAERQKGQEQDVKRGNEGSIKPECSSEQSRYGESWNA